MFAALATPHIPPALRDPSFLETVYEAATRTGEARVGAELRHVLAEDVVLPPSDIDWTAPVLERLEAGPTAETLRRLPRVESPGWIWPRVRRSALGPLLARRSHRNRAGRTRRLARVSALAAAVVLSAILLGRFAGPFFGTNGFSTGTAPETRNSSELEVVFHFTPTPLVEGYAPAAILDGRRG